MENVSDAGIMGDNVYSSYFEGAFISDFGKFDSEYMERPSTKLVSRIRDSYHCETCSKHFHCSDGTRSASRRPTTGAEASKQQRSSSST